MSKKEFHKYAIICECGNEGVETEWEWENPMHHDSDFSSYYDSHDGKFTRKSGGNYVCDVCGASVQHA